MHTDAGGIQGTGGDLSVDDPGAHPANDEYVQPAPPELPAQALKRYRQTILELLYAEDTIPAALRCVQAHHLQCLLSFVCLFVHLFVFSSALLMFCSFNQLLTKSLICSFVCLYLCSTLLS